jgi:dipeptidyl aminopeptidase/acylaminoacyl peptidase
LYSLADCFTARGYAVVLANWLVGWLNDQSELSNAFCALAWLHTNAEEYGFDPERVAVFGHSAGGYAAALLGAVDDSTEFMQDCPHLLPESG